MKAFKFSLVPASSYRISERECHFCRRRGKLAATTSPMREIVEKGSVEAGF
jgi:hypothetical protein